MCPEDAVKSVFKESENRYPHGNYFRILSYFENNKNKNVECDMKNLTIKNDLIAAFPGLNLEEFKTIHDESLNVSEFAKKLVNEACKEKIVKNIPKNKTEKDIDDFSVALFEGETLVGVFESERPKILDKINHGLSSARPVGIGFSAGGLIETVSSTPVAHGSVIAGRKWFDEIKDDKGQITLQAGCYYLAKNSWGEDWKVAKTSKARSSNDYPGYFWMSEKSMMEHVHSTTYIK